ncbi:hypothetical protein HLB44_15980 [Aquincola sp. S2]|uniref:Effector protein BipC n=1 Tax=Pseudaquabacterium terrae TaxID=2732868 RepID=A0ABX2EIN3_9BURK|nr:hypothetical protein [Aquabacterium terrae]NRF68494.1 hypothetical protein [Aquabacterium terrae]
MNKISQTPPPHLLDVISPGQFEGQTPLVPQKTRHKGTSDVETRTSNEQTQRPRGRSPLGPRAPAVSDNPKTAETMLNEGIGKLLAKDSRGTKAEVFNALRSAMSGIPGSDKLTTEFDTLQLFVANVPKLKSDVRADKDLQLAGLKMAQYIYSDIAPTLNAESKNAMALEVMGMSSQVESHAHTHSLKAEAKKLARPLVNLTKQNPIAGLAVGIHAVAGAPGVIGLLAGAMAQQDKTSSQALDFLTDVLGSMKPGEMNMAVLDAATDVLYGSGLSEAKQRKLDNALCRLTGEEQGTGVPGGNAPPPTNHDGTASHADTSIRQTDADLNQRSDTLDVSASHDGLEHQPPTHGVPMNNIGKTGQTTGLPSTPSPELLKTKPPKQNKGNPDLNTRTNNDSTQRTRLQNPFVPHKGVPTTEGASVNAQAMGQMLGSAQANAVVGDSAMQSLKNIMNQQSLQTGIDAMDRGLMAGITAAMEGLAKMFKNRGESLKNLC